jgi:hypothetical protein
MNPPNIQYEVVPTKDQRILLVVDALEKKFLNGGVILRSFRPVSKWHVDPSFRPDLVGIEHDLICLLQAESVRSAVPELQIPFPLQKLPRYAYYSAFEFEGAVTSSLLCSGAYVCSKFDEETARKISRDFVDALSNGDKFRTRVFSIHEPWSEWFHGIAWDHTFVAIDGPTGRWTLFCFTDTD